MRFVQIKAVSIFNSHLIDYPTPAVNYFSSFGSLSGMCLVIQIVTGVLLAMHYTPNTLLAFISIEHIIRDVNDGWIIRYYHSNGASVFFLCVYWHIYNNYSSEADDLLWLSGLLLYLLIIATAFIGYILPWGQISFWGATVITNLFSAIPLVGLEIAHWLWGGFSVDNPTLNRFFSLHYLLPFLIVACVLLHLSLLHLDESSNEDSEYIEFYYYYFIKDLFVFLILLLIYQRLVFAKPGYLSHPDNCNIASAIVTPAHLVPEWYFLPFYAVLRATPDRFGGLILIFLILVDLFLIDIILDDKIISFELTDASADLGLADWIEGDIEEDFDAGALFILIFLGKQGIDEPFTDLASILTIIQFIDYFDFSFEYSSSQY